MFALHRLHSSFPDILTMVSEEDPYYVSFCSAYQVEPKAYHNLVLDSDTEEHFYSEDLDAIVLTLPYFDQ